jgi:hypothetical protein
VTNIKLTELRVVAVFEGVHGELLFPVNSLFMTSRLTQGMHEKSIE